MARVWVEEAVHWGSPWGSTSSVVPPTNGNHFALTNWLYYWRKKNQVPITFQVSQSTSPFQIFKRAFTQIWETFHLVWQVNSAVFLVQCPLFDTTDSRLFSIQFLVACLQECLRLFSLGTESWWHGETDGYTEESSNRGAEKECRIHLYL